LGFMSSFIQNFRSSVSRGEIKRFGRKGFDYIVFSNLARYYYLFKCSIERQMIDQDQLFATYYIRVSLKLVFIAQNAKLFLAHLCSPLSFVDIEPTFGLCHAPKVVRHHTILILSIRYR
jgi:hypothetical protein